MTRAALGLDRPLFIQYVDWMANFLTGNMGFSFADRQPVLDIISQRLGPTLLLMSISLIVAYATAIPLGIIAALHKNSKLDRAICSRRAAWKSSGWKMMASTWRNIWFFPSSLWRRSFLQI